MLETVVMEKTIPRRGSPFPARRQSTMPANSEVLHRQPSTVGSPRLANGLGSPRSISGTGPGSPTMHALFSGGSGLGTPVSQTPTPTPNRGGMRSPTSPASRSPYTSPRLLPVDIRQGSPRPVSPFQRPSSPLAGATHSQYEVLEIARPPNLTMNGVNGDLHSDTETDRPPPTPEKDHRYILPATENSDRHDSLFGDRPISEEPSQVEPVVALEGGEGHKDLLSGVVVNDRNIE